MTSRMYGFKAFIFDGKKTARKAFDTLEDYTPAYAWIDDVAGPQESSGGVRSTRAQRLLDQLRLVHTVTGRDASDIK